MKASSLSTVILAICLVGGTMALDICSSPLFTLPLSGTLEFFGTSNCTTRATLLPRTWMRLTSNSYVLWAQTYFPQCDQESIYVEFQRRPIPEMAYLCGTGGIEPLISGLDVELSVLEVKLQTTGSITSYFSVESLLARVIHTGENAIVSEPAEQFDQIVSHARYLQAVYSGNIDSTLTLTGFEISTELRIQLEDFNLAGSNCSDFLRVSGAVYRNQFPITICNGSINVYNILTIRENVSFNFVANGEDNSDGFLIRYEQINPGCPADGVRRARIEYNTTRRSFVAICEAGYFFNDTRETIKSTTCRSNTSTWDVVECTDMNECLVDNGGCSDICNNTIGSYYCLCSKPEDILLQDGLTCYNPNSVDGNDGGDNLENTGSRTGSTQEVNILLRVVLPLLVVIANK